MRKIFLTYFAFIFPLLLFGSGVTLNVFKTDKTVQRISLDNTIQIINDNNNSLVVIKGSNGIFTEIAVSEIDSITYTEERFELPTIETISVNNNVENGKTECVIDILSNGGSSIIERGVVWSTAANPDINSDKYTAGHSTGKFYGFLADLDPTKSYNVRGFATNCVGTAYGNTQILKPRSNDNYVAYLFSYFTGNNDNEEAVRYAISADGFNYRTLKNNRPVIESKEISSTGGVRDPHILRGEDGKTFYMVLTDMVSANGWNSNRAMILLKSSDLINWSSTVINIQEKYANQENLLRVWAPQTIYDKEANKYMVYWSMKHGNSPDIIYYAYANESFTDIEGEPQQLFFPESEKSCIDGDIIFKDGLYYMFYKTEGHGNGIKLATTKSLTSGLWHEYDDYKQQTSHAVEGSSVFQLINSDTYIMMYDVYMAGSYQFTETTDLKNFSIIDKSISMDFKPRHGSVIPITQNELIRLTNEWGVPNDFPDILNNSLEILNEFISHFEK